MYLRHLSGHIQLQYRRARVTTDHAAQSASLDTIQRPECVRCLEIVLIKHDTNILVPNPGYQ